MAGTDDLARDVKAASRAKPLWAHIEDMGASAAYWVASQASKITANSETALVGSIGTLQVIHDHTGQTHYFFPYISCCLRSWIRTAVWEPA